MGGDNGNGPGRHRCSYYGPSAWILSPCPSLAEAPPWLVYDGANVGATLGERWVFVQGGGVDDPLMGLYRSSSQPGAATEYYWITDGAGRHLAAGAANGGLLAGSPEGMQYLNLGGKFVGTTQAATGYHAERQVTASAPTLSLFRNRVYDQRTGRWAQEDPIGIAGGLNLYQFNGSNPSALTDPFGLWPRPRLVDDFTRALVRAATSVVGAVRDFKENYSAMRKANTIGADKYFHCKANCEATRRGPVGELTAKALSAGRELSDILRGKSNVDSAQADMDANSRGRSGAQANPEQPCAKACEVDRPRGLPEDY